MNPLEKLTAAFERFPGIGPRQARRFVHYLLTAPPGVRSDVANLIQRLGADVSQCKKCFRWSIKSEGRGGLCSICGNTHRDATTIFVVEKDANIETVERSGFRGLYFVLGGTVPLAAEEPSQHIRLRELLARVEQDASEAKLQEIILGLSATTEGDHTRLLLQEKLLPVAQGLNFKITSLGRGLSTGSELEYADPDTIQNALNSRV
jgi:recombination protein RecR